MLLPTSTETTKPSPIPMTMLLSSEGRSRRENGAEESRTCLLVDENDADDRGRANTVAQVYMRTGSALHSRQLNAETDLKVNRKTEPDVGKVGEEELGTRGWREDLHCEAGNVDCSSVGVS